MMKPLLKKLNIQCLNPYKKVQLSISLRTLNKTVAKGLFCIFPAVIFSGMIGNDSSAEASDWMFEQSYFSHSLSPEEARHFPQPESKGAYRRAYANFAPGTSVRGGYRFNRIFLRSGNSTDMTVIREDWFGFQE